MKQIRKDLHLSQQDLALLLNVSRSTICHYEKGIRNMPVHALEKWVHLQSLWQQNQTQKLPAFVAENKFLKLQEAEALERLNLHVQQAAARAISLTQQLTQMETLRRQLVQKLMLLARLRQETPTGSRQFLLLKNRQQMTLLRLTECCAARQELLALKLQVLQSQQRAALAGKVNLLSKR